MNRRLLFADKTLNTSMLKDGIYYLKVKDNGDASLRTVSPAGTGSETVIGKNRTYKPVGNRNQFHFNKGVFQWCLNP